jgi:ssDNA-binding Zn-finger/Zn-ribbon topoisomerase 1
LFSVELSNFHISHAFPCPDCGKPLIHYKGSKNGKAFNFWACSDKTKCGSKFFDNNGQQGAKQTPIELSNYDCSECGQKLRHVVKEGAGGYNFWACSNSSCGFTFKDNEGKPGDPNPKKAKTPPSNYKCPSCKSPLYHRKGHNVKTDKDYDFFACSNINCGKTYPAKDDKPDFPVSKSNKKSGKR